MHRSSAKKRYDENLIKNLLSKILDFSFKTLNHTLPLIISHPFQHLSYCHSYSLSCLTHFLLSFLLLLFILSDTFPPVIPTLYPDSHLSSCHSYFLSCLTPFLLSFLLFILTHTFPPVIPTLYPDSHITSCHSYSLSCLTPFLLPFVLVILSYTFPLTIRICYLFSYNSYSHFLYNLISPLNNSSSNNSFLITQHSLGFFSVGHSFQQGTGRNQAPGQPTQRDVVWGTSVLIVLMIVTSVNIYEQTHVIVFKPLYLALSYRSR